MDERDDTDGTQCCPACGGLRRVGKAPELAAACAGVELMLEGVRASLEGLQDHIDALTEIATG